MKYNNNNNKLNNTNGKIIGQCKLDEGGSQ